MSDPYAEILRLREAESLADKLGREGAPRAYAVAFADAVTRGNATAEVGAKALVRFHRARVPVPYALAALGAGLDVESSIEAWASGVPLDYVTA